MREAIKDLCSFVKKSGKPIEKIQVFSGKKEKLESIKNKLEPFDDLELAILPVAI